MNTLVKLGPIVSELFETPKVTYSFFSGNTKRYAVLYDELQNVENSPMLTNLSLTTVARKAAAHAVIICII